jgi:hypothetical protein
MNLKKILAFATLAITICIAKAYAQEVVWTKYLYGAPASTDARLGGMNEYSGRLAIATDSSGNLIATGRVNTGAGFDWVTVKYSPTGGELWRAVLNGAGSIERLSAQVGGSSTAFDEARAIAIDSVGNIVVTGHTVADSAGGPRRCTIAKYSPDGIEIWRKQSPLPNTGVWMESLCFGVWVDANDHIVTAGSARSSTQQGALTAGVVMKHDSNGNVLWEDVLISPEPGRVYESNRVAFDSQNHVYVTHYAQASSASIEGSWIVRKLNAVNGAQSWRYDRNNSVQDDFALAIAVSQSSPARVAVVGYEFEQIESGNAARASAVFLDAATGIEVHHRYFGSPIIGSFDQSRAVFFHGEDAYIGGTVSNQMFGAKINSNHELAWQTTYGAPGSATLARAAAISPDGHRFAIAGYVGTTNSINDNNSVAFQLDTATGAIIDASTFVAADTGRDEAYATVFASDGSLFLGGTQAVGVTHTFSLRKFAAAGPVLWATSLAPHVVTAQLNNSGRIARRLIKTNSLGETYVASWALANNDGLHATSLVKLSPNGDAIWNIRFLNTLQDISFPRDLRLDSNENVILVSDRTITTPPPTSSARSLFVRKFDSTGTLIWAVSHQDAPSTASSGRAVAIGSDNSVYIASSMFTEATAGTLTRPYADWVIQKLAAATGDIVWTYRTDGGSNLDDRAMEIAVDGTSIFVAGVVNNGTDASAALRNDNWRVIKLYDGATPTLAWSESTANPGNDVVQSLSLLSGAGRIYVVGHTSGNDGYASKFSVGSYATDANTSSFKTLFTTSGSDLSSTLNTAMDVVARNDGAFAVGSLGYEGGTSGAVIVRVDTLGNEICRWTQPIPAAGRTGVFNSVAPIVDGIVVTGMWDALDGSSAMITAQFNDLCQPMWFSEVNNEQTRELGLALRTILAGPYVGRVIAAGYGREANQPHTTVLQAIDPVTSCTLDFDGDNSVKATTDGALAIRAIDSPVTAAHYARSVTSKTGLRSAASAANYATNSAARGHLDVDGDGKTTAKVDGLLLLRAMLGLTGQSVTDQIEFAANATRRVWLESTNPSAANSIRLYLRDVCGFE